MALYLGANKILPVLVNNVSWWGGRNPVFLYEANYTNTLNNMTNWSPSVPVTTGGTALKYPTYSDPSINLTSNSATYFTFDRWGVGANYHNGEALDFSQYNYFVLADNIIIINYITNEATLNKPHAIKYTQTIFYPIGQWIKLNGDNLVYPSSDVAATTTAATTYSQYLLWYRTSAGVLTRSVTNYGFYTTGLAPSFQSTAALTCNYINFRTPYWYVRGHNTDYQTLDSFNDVNASTTTLKVRQRLYRVDKAGQTEIAVNRFGYMYEHNDFPTELI